MNLKTLILVTASGLIAFGAGPAHAAGRAPSAKKEQPRLALPLFEGRNAALDNSFRAQAARNTDAAIRIETHYDRHSR